MYVCRAEVLAAGEVVDGNREYDEKGGRARAEDMVNRLLDRSTFRLPL